MTIKILVRLAVVCAAAAVFTFTFGSPGGTLLQRNVVMVTSPNVALDLNLSKQQIADRDQLIGAYSKARNAVDEGFTKATTDAQRDALNAEINRQQEDLETKLLALLTPAQTNRLRQIGIQQEGVSAMQDEGVAKDLSLTAAQRAKVKAVCEQNQKAQEDYQAALGDAIAKIPDPGSADSAMRAYAGKQEAVIKSMKPREKQYLAIKAEGERQILASLTPAQKNKWAALHGKPLKAG
jgi:Spy/CpxP family protein refolding chaperone